MSRVLVITNKEFSITNKALRIGFNTGVTKEEFLNALKESLKENNVKLYRVNGFELFNEVHHRYEVKRKEKYNAENVLQCVNNVLATL
jgi:hypothetical protein